MRLAPTPRAQRLSRSGVICLFYGALLAISIAVGAMRGRANVFVLQPAGSRPVLGLVIGLLLGLGAVFLTRLFTHRLQWARVLHQEFHALVHGLGPGEIFLLALSSSVAEEAFFRGALQPLVGLYVQALLFAAMHFRPRRRFYPWTIMSLVIGLVFGALAQSLGDLTAPIVAHFVINGLNLSYIARTELRA